jgi:hypothetical protein
LDNEVAIIKAEMFCILMKQHGEDPFFQAISFGIAAAIHKHIFLSGVAMIVTVEEDISAFQSLPHHHFNCKVLRTHLGRRGSPLSI